MIPMNPSARLQRLASLVVLSVFLTACLSPVLPAFAPPTAPPTPTQTSTPSPTPTATSTPLPTQTPRPTATPEPTITPTPAPVVRRVLLLSIDGLRPDAITLAPMPVLQSLMLTGAYSLTAQTIFPSSTLPSHASMLTGLCPSKHGVDWNDYEPEQGYANGTDVFDLAHAAGLKTAMIVGKKKLIQLTEPQSLDLYQYINDRDLVITDWVINNFPEDFGLLFIHFPTPDGMGHEYGWLSPEQLSVIRRADEALGLLLNALDQRGLRQETLIIVTADHGGHEQTHGSRNLLDTTIPWVISGPGVRATSLSTPIQTTDTAATIAWALNLPRPPEMDGWPVFEAFGQPIQPRPQPFCP